MAEETWMGAAVVAAGAGFMAYAVRGRSSRIFGASVHRGDPAHATLALTFDDGPSESTPALLEILSKHQVRGTFFMCGKNVRRLPQVAREVLAGGHEIGNHTDTHPRLDFKSPEFIYGEMALAQETIRQTTGTTPCLFRAPYGVRWFGVRRAQQRLGLTGVMWTLIANDWRLPASRICTRVTSGATNGGILCLHDGRGVQATPDIRATLSAVDTAIPILKQRGFQFQSVSEMIWGKN